ncbi:MAG: histidine kinase [Rhodoferax sp.]|nr:histidine kinase [Rhodoferax sp.]
MRIDWPDKLNGLLRTLAACLAVSVLIFSLQPTRPYEPALVYSLCIGITTWALIDFGRHLFPSAAASGWPTGFWGLALPLVGIALGYAIGITAADIWFARPVWSLMQIPRYGYSVVISIVFSGAVTYYFYSRNKSAHLQQQAEKASLQASEARLRLLETQLEPHMLFNTLANLRVLVGRDPQSAVRMLDHLIAYLRATLAASRASSHSLGDEFDRLRDYLELMAVRMGPRLQYTLDLPDSLRDLAIPSLLLQPLVENSIQHGLEPQVGGGTITVSARQDGNLLTLQVQDTGVGLGQPAAEDKQPGGFGLTQVRERLATLYGNASAIDLIAAPAGGTRATITFPLNSPV